MFCNNCGKEISDEAVICVHCGVATGRPMPGAQVNPVPAAAPVNDPNEPANVGFVVLSVFFSQSWIKAFLVYEHGF